MTATPRTRTAVVGIVMGSDSDLPVMRGAAEALAEFQIPFEVRVISAHRTPEDALTYARNAAPRGMRVLIAGAGAAAALPGVLAAATPLPVVGVPIGGAALSGMDALFSIAQMPPGVPVATVAIGGARNAALLAIRILSLSDANLRRRLEQFQAELAASVRLKDQKVQAEFESES